MNRNLALLITSEFLSAFADNAVLFSLVSLVQQSADTPGWYIPALQAAFLVAFVFLAPWVGAWSDAHRKNRVLVQGSLIKLAGASLLLLHVEPLYAYALIGIGAAIYSPAKYGILPEIADEKLVHANGWVESTTIIAILGGGLTGAVVADHSLTAAFSMIAGLYIVSALFAWQIRAAKARSAMPTGQLKRFIENSLFLLRDASTRTAITGASIFWGSAVTLRLTIVAWAPLILGLMSASEIAGLTIFSAIGIAIGSLLAGKLVKLEQFDRARNAALFMGATIVVLSTVESLWMARVLLLLIGIGGGIFIVPINALVQHYGHRTIGPGKSVATQRFMENLTMLGASGLFALYAGNGGSPTSAIAILGVIVIALVWIIGGRLANNRTG